MTLGIEIARIGEGQLMDVERSGREVHNGYARTCTVFQGSPPVSAIGDTTPHVLARLYGGSWRHWNRHFIIQVARCPLNCWYCYVDNLNPDMLLSIEELIDCYQSFKNAVPNLNVFHLMGGCPGRYAHLWGEIRDGLDRRGFTQTVFLTDVTLVEHAVYGVRPWECIPDRSLVSVCVKGTSRGNFLRNTGMDMFPHMVEELLYYVGRSDVHFSVLRPYKGRWYRDFVDSLEGSIDHLRVRRYEAVKRSEGDAGL